MNNNKLNKYNFTALGKIKKLKRKLLYTDNIKSIWSIKDAIKELEHNILINEQQVRFNLLKSMNEHAVNIHAKMNTHN